MDVTLPMLQQTPRDGETADTIGGSLSMLVESGRKWLAAETRLVQAHLAADKKRLILLVALCAVSLASVCAAFMLLVYFLVALLAPYVGGIANAAGLLGLLMLMMTAVLVWIIVRISTSQSGAAAVLKRWSRLITQGPGRSS